MASQIIEDARAARQLPDHEVAREIRVAAGLTQRQVANELGVSTLTILRWESGRQRPQPRFRAPYSRLLAQLREDLGL